MTPTLVRIVGVYHADGSLRGELAYLLGKILGTTQCSLCDITHAGLRRKRELAGLHARVSVPLEFIHLDEQTPAVRAFTAGRTPCVLGMTDAGCVLLLDTAALSQCEGRVARFESALLAAIRVLTDS